MTREEILAEISELRIDIEKYNDDIRRWSSSRQREQDEEYDRYESARVIEKGYPPKPGPTAVQHSNNQMQKCTEGREARRRRIHELESQLQVMDNSRLTGTIKWFNAEKNFGFIKVDGKTEDAHVHGSAFVEKGNPEEGDPVTFKCTRGAKGLKAVEVRFVPVD